jgi:hypothetical protein
VVGKPNHKFTSLTRRIIIASFKLTKKYGFSIWANIYFGGIEVASVAPLGYLIYPFLRVFNWVSRFSGQRQV